MLLTSLTLAAGSVCRLSDLSTAGPRPLPLSLGYGILLERGPAARRSKSVCTVCILYEVVPGFPAVVAGNRDEFLGRPSQGPHLWTPQGVPARPVLFAGKDLECGGTWMGVNPSGLVCGVTNVSSGFRDPSKRSRGLLVLDCLAARSPLQALEILHTRGVDRYNPFNLFCLSPEGGFFLSNAVSPPRLVSLTRGAHVITNRPLGDPSDSRRDKIRSALDSAPGSVDDLERFLSALLARHGDPGTDEALCVHLPGYGTVSSHILFLCSDLGKSRFRYAPGPPCSESFQDLSQNLSPLFDASCAPGLA